MADRALPCKSLPSNGQGRGPSRKKRTFFSLPFFIIYAPWTLITYVVFPVNMFLFSVIILFNYCGEFYRSMTSFLDPRLVLLWTLILVTYASRVALDLVNLF
jgi:hypothetical protein